MAPLFVKWVIFCGVLGLTLVFVSGFGLDNVAGPGVWSVVAVLRCDDPDQYPVRVIINRRKINRTHDVFDCEFDVVEEDIDEKYAVRIDACKWVDGGCKPFTVITDNCFCNFIKKHGGENYDKIMRAMNLDPPDCPVPKAKYVVDAFMVNYEEMPSEAIYGRFGATLVLVKDAKDVGCVKYEIEFNEKKD